jgi:gas vesicle protein
MSDESSSFGWFLAGLGLGAVVGVLYAPRSGSETREAILNRAEEGREYVRTRARDAKDQASEWVDRGRDVVNQQKDQFRAAYEAGRQAYQDATSDSAAPAAASPKNI